MTIGRCKTCRFWDDKPSYQTPMHIRLCTKIKEFWEVTKWPDNDDDDDYMTRVLLPGHENDLAFAQDGSDYKAYLLTAAEFGCTMHEPKP